jgi:hypothetical protein
MRLEIEFEGKNGTRVHNWDLTSGNNVFETLESSGDQVVVENYKFVNFQQIKQTPLVLSAIRTHLKHLKLV